MMKVSFGHKRKCIILLVAVCQLLNTSCSKQLYPDPSYQNIKSQSEKKKLKYFMNAGTEKVINTHNTNANEIIKTAQKYLGVPHCMGGTTMRCLDCSGLLAVVFAKNGINLPHNSQEQARYGRKIDAMDELIKGDLVFFIRSYKTHSLITHSGIYLGNKKFIHTSSKNGVIITSLNDPWWKEKYIFGTRVFE